MCERVCERETPWEATGRAPRERERPRPGDHGGGGVPRTLGRCPRQRKDRLRGDTQAQPQTAGTRRRGVRCPAAASRVPRPRAAAQLVALFWNFLGCHFYTLHLSSLGVPFSCLHAYVTVGHLGVSRGVSTTGLGARARRGPGSRRAGQWVEKRLSSPLPKLVCGWGGAVGNPGSAGAPAGAHAAPSAPSPGRWLRVAPRLRTCWKSPRVLVRPGAPAPRLTGSPGAPRGRAGERLGPCHLPSAPCWSPSARDTGRTVPARC